MLVIKELRKNRKESQTDLSKILKVSLRTIQNYESGSVSVPNDKLKEIAEHYNVSVSSLFDEKSNRTPPPFIKNGVEVNIKEMLNYIVEHEDELIEEEKLYKDFLENRGRKYAFKFMIENKMLKPNE